eukprot:g6569.t1
MGAPATLSSVLLLLVLAAADRLPAVEPTLQTDWTQTCASTGYKGTHAYTDWDITYGANGTGSEEYSYWPYVYGKQPCRTYTNADSGRTAQGAERFSYQRAAALDADGKPSAGADELVLLMLDELNYTLFDDELVTAYNNATSGCLCGGVWVKAMARTFRSASDCNATTCPRMWKAGPGAYDPFTPKVYGTLVGQVTLDPRGSTRGALQGCVLAQTQYKYMPQGSEASAASLAAWTESAAAKEAAQDLAGLRNGIARGRVDRFTRRDDAPCSTLVAQSALEQPAVVALLVIMPVLAVGGFLLYRSHHADKAHELRGGGDVELPTTQASGEEGAAATSTAVVRAGQRGSTQDAVRANQATVM